MASVMVEYFSLINEVKDDDKLTQGMVMDLTCKELQAVGAYWKHDHLFSAICGEVVAMTLDRLYGRGIRVLVDSESEYLAIMMTCGAKLVKSTDITAKLLDIKFSDRPYNRDLADKTYDTVKRRVEERLQGLMEDIVDAMRQASEKVVEGEVVTSDEARYIDDAFNQLEAIVGGDSELLTPKSPTLH